MTGGSKMSHLGHLGSILECMIGTDLVVPRLIKHDMIRTRLCQKLQDESTLRHTHTSTRTQSHTTQSRLASCAPMGTPGEQE